ncbi:hypothetical protein C6497_11720 [Candidatus Poribacteria bacterium]|nr:MAG: hypothetical protein C6497_11720 [Candidatus Poribacteria bacterium]
MYKLFLPIMLLSILIMGCIPDSPLDPDETSNPTYITTQFIMQGAKVVSNDGTDTFLGEITGKYNSNSIFNNYGIYGSKYSVTSIWNPYSIYGSKYSIYSAFNDYTITPPQIIKNNTRIGYLTTNKHLHGGVSPNLLKSLF